jgi:hypothetical protein
MADKDLNEIRVLQARSPEAWILICVFHVIKYLAEMANNPAFGSIAPEDRLAVDHLLSNLTNASSADVYEQERQALKLLCERIHSMEFFDYFERSWD